MLRWRVVDGELTDVEVVRQRLGTFEDFTPGESDEAVDGVAAHDAFGTE
jgi:hypothetical protein